MTLNELNSLIHDDAVDWFMQTCAAQNWCIAMSQARPFASCQDVSETAQDIWAKCDTGDFLQAFEAHPMIGDVNSLREKFKNTKAMACNEQSGAQSASDETLQALHNHNHAYLKKHGFIFIIFATGKTADQMLQALQNRINNDTATEIANAAAQQLKIAILRIEKNLISDKIVKDEN